ncbi:uncharacterized protein BX663DRAFT_470706 [Cokeromyces recurvatus]|uniref:uncharacterized protein n=1 Tax=Cokeromyces recurvatus TaxID=90255 RepID=UPI0022211D58|nr:uncharacterized protein BX663DRAFT_470706 [Cokeromyces recurvatus]KAI7903787.1 hypothetical protein BX663DRAFT_470706 [Cokeromyces recurvatus]
MSPYSSRDIALFFIAFFFPPASVAIKTGCSVDLLINICLCALGAIPGIIHGFYIVHKYNDNVEDIESGGLRYERVAAEDPSRIVYGATNPN